MVKFLRAVWLLLVEILAVSLVCYGVSLVFLPAAFMLGGAAVVFAIERYGKAAAARAARERLSTVRERKSV